MLEQNDRDRVHDDERGDRVVVSWHDDDVVRLGADVLPGISAEPARITALHRQTCTTTAAHGTTRKRREP